MKLWRVTSLTVSDGKVVLGVERGGTKSQVTVNYWVPGSSPTPRVDLLTLES